VRLIRYALIMKRVIFGIGIVLALPFVAQGETGVEQAWPDWHPLQEARVADVRKDPASSMSVFVYERLLTIQELIEDGELAKALSSLDSLSQHKINTYERAHIERTRGYIHSQQRDDPRAFEAFEASVQLDILPTAMQQSLLYSLATFHASSGRHSESNETLMRWFRYEMAPDAGAYLLMGSNYLQLDERMHALPYVRRANALAKPPREAWKQIELAILFEAKRHGEAIELLADMIRIWSDRVRYYATLSGLLVETGQAARALSVLMVPWLDGLLVDDEDILTLARLHIYQGNPDRAARILQQAIERAHLPADDEEVHELLVAAWTEARELERAVEALSQMAQISNRGDLMLRKAQLLSEAGDWESVVSASRSALEMGGLERPGEAWMLSGIALAELERFDESMNAFEGARREGSEDVRENAAVWISYVRDRSSAPSN